MAAKASLLLLIMRLRVARSRGRVKSAESDADGSQISKREYPSTYFEKPGTETSREAGDFSIFPIPTAGINAFYEEKRQFFNFHTAFV
jgi:hypothetical protein